MVDVQYNAFSFTQSIKKCAKRLTAFEITNWLNARAPCFNPYNDFTSFFTVVLESSSHPSDIRIKISRSIFDATNPCSITQGFKDQYRCDAPTVITRMDNGTGVCENTLR